MLVQRMIVQAALKLVTKQFKLDKVLKYVEEPNELDEEVKQLKKENEEMKADIQFLKKLLIKEK